mmetsp:Transcript_3422/g.15048  ORF Transcript_3422/g.15048 Transcript_3422/m.15048 type:complete len:250 (+) Transcript_3422:418-1167(+)
MRTMSGAGTGAEDHERRARRRVRASRRVFRGELLEPGRRAEVGARPGRVRRGTRRVEASTVVRIRRIQRRFLRRRTPLSLGSPAPPRRSDRSNRGWTRRPRYRRARALPTHGAESHAAGRVDSVGGASLAGRVDGGGGARLGAQVGEAGADAVVFRGGERGKDHGAGERGIVPRAQGRARGSGRARSAHPRTEVVRRRPNRRPARMDAGVGLARPGRERREGDPERGVRRARAVRAGLREKPAVDRRRE